ncbi:unnamed protein product [Caenorhabditis angaria]|uniref:Uncharacterized protein n=1 Tax=Caenorhabditis angaria TaxID=860376 RepID=A0A9P1ITY3_9PELO|nr:unnamed protein product [Caenorhabditis angaria]
MEEIARMGQKDTVTRRSTYESPRVLLTRKIEQYNEEVYKSSAMLTEIVDLIFKVVREERENMWETYKICQKQLHKEREEKVGTFRRAIENYVERFSLKISVEEELSHKRDDDNTIFFFALLTIGIPELPDSIIPKLLNNWFRAIECNDIFEKDYEEKKKLKNEYPIQCGIVFMKSCGLLMIKQNLMNVWSCWCERLVILKPCFEIITQKMIEELFRSLPIGLQGINVIIEHLESKIEQMEEYEQVLKEQNDNLKNIIEESKNKDVEDIDSKSSLTNPLKDQMEKDSNDMKALRLKLEEMEKVNENLKRMSNGITISCPNVRRIHQKYHKILKTDYDSLLPKITSDINSLIQSQPDSTEILMMKVEVLKFKEGFDEYIRKVNEDYWKIERNPNILVQKLGNREVEMFPSDEFMENIRKLNVESEKTIVKHRVKWLDDDDFPNVCLFTITMMMYQEERPRIRQEYIVTTRSIETPRVLLTRKIEQYNEELHKSSALLTEIIDSIFKLVCEEHEKLWDTFIICQNQINKEREQKIDNFRKAIGNYAERFSVKVSSEDLRYKSDNHNTILFFALLTIEVPELPDSIIPKLLNNWFRAIKCNDIFENDYVCSDRNCPYKSMSEAEKEKFKNEYPIQCGIVFMKSCGLLMIKQNLMNVWSYWCERLGKLRPFFGIITYKMIGELFRSLPIGLRGIDKGNADNKILDLKNEIIEKLEENIKKMKEYEHALEMKVDDYRNIMEELKNKGLGVIRIVETKDVQLAEMTKMCETVIYQNEILKADLEKNAINKKDLELKVVEMEKVNENLKRGSNRISITCPNVRRIHQKYHKILKTDYDSLLPKITSQINSLIQKQPDSDEILQWKVDVLRFKKGIDEYLRKVNEDYWKIERNPDISMGKLGNEEVEMFPSDAFMETIRKMIM